MSQTITFEHETERHWGSDDETCVLTCTCEASYSRHDEGFGSGWEVGQVEILSAAGAEPILGEELRSELEQAALAAAQSQAESPQEIAWELDRELEDNLP